MARKYKSWKCFKCKQSIVGSEALVNARKSDKDRELWQYFMDRHLNANPGCKAYYEELVRNYQEKVDLRLFLGSR